MVSTAKVTRHRSRYDGVVRLLALASAMLCNRGMHNPTITALASALASSNDNLRDCADMDAAAMAEVQADNAALEHLLGNDATGQPRILAYL